MSEYIVKISGDKIKRKDIVVIADTTIEVGSELVRCKDCKYWNDAGLCKKHSSPIVGAIYGTDADDYCSEGERKEQENE